MADVELVTIPNVELLEVGENWLTSTGKFTITVEDIQSAIAALDSPDVRTPVLKFGHTDPRFGMADGEFSVGRITNLRASADGMTLVGDLVGVPLWLAKIMPSAYPRRSIEGNWGSLGRSEGLYDGFVLTGLSLLGAFYPAITTLEDMQAFWTGEDPPMYDASTGEIVALSSVIAATVPVEDSVPNPDKKAMRATTVAASTRVEDIRRQWYDNEAKGYSWIREMYVDPPEIIWDDDDGELYRQPYTITGDEITFGESVKVKIEYVAATARPIAAAVGQDVAERATRETVAVYATRDEARDGIVTSDPDAPQEGEMKLSEKALKALGLPADATEEQINAALEAQAEATPEPTPDPEPTPEPTPDPDPEPTPTPEDAPTEGGVLIDAATLADLRAGAEAGRAAAKRFADQERDKVLSAAVKDGKFPRSRLEHYTKLWAADAEGTKALITSLEAGLVPTAEIGAGDAPESDADTGYPASWAPKASGSGDLTIITA